MYVPKQILNSLSLARALYFARALSFSLFLSVCPCLKGYQGRACEIECTPSEIYRYQQPVGDRFVCTCKEGWIGERCNKRDPKMAILNNRSLVENMASTPRKSILCTNLICVLTVLLLCYE